MLNEMDRIEELSAPEAAYYGPIAPVGQQGLRNLHKFTYLCRQAAHVLPSDMNGGIASAVSDSYTLGTTSDGDSVIGMMKGLRHDVMASNGLIWWGVEPGEEGAVYDVICGGESPGQFTGFPVYLGEGDSGRADNIFMKGAVSLSDVEHEIDEETLLLLHDHAKAVAQHILFRRDFGFAEMDFYVLNEGNICNILSKLVASFGLGRGGLDEGAFSSILSQVKISGWMNKLFDSMCFNFHPILQPAIQRENREARGDVPLGYRGPLCATATCFEEVCRLSEQKMQDVTEKIVLMAISRLILSGRLEKSVLGVDVERRLSEGNYIPAMDVEYEVMGEHAAAFVAYKLLYTNDIASYPATDCEMNESCRVMFYEDVKAHLVELGVSEVVVDKFFVSNGLELRGFGLKVVRRSQTPYEVAGYTSQNRHDAIRAAGIAYGGEADFEVLLNEAVPYFSDCDLRMGIMPKDYVQVFRDFEELISSDCRSLGLNSMAQRSLVRRVLVPMAESFTGTEGYRYFGVSVFRIQNILQTLLGRAESEQKPQGVVDMYRQSLEHLNQYIN